MKSLQRIKKVLIEVLQQLEDRGHGFICLEIDSYGRSEELIVETMDYLKDNKPSNTQHKEFFDNKLFTGNHAWWNSPDRKKSTPDYDLIAIQEETERRRFIEYLINQI